MAIRHEVPSALREAAQAVAATRGRLLQLRRTFDRSLIPMMIVDNHRRLLEMNAAGRLVSRMSLRELRRLRIDDLSADHQLSALKEAWSELFARGTVSDRYSVLFRDGSTLSVYFTAISNLLPGGHLVVFVPADWPDIELEDLHPATEPILRGPLSTRQAEVLRLVAVGARAAEMADELYISEATVRTHVQNILERLGAKNRAHAVALAMSGGLLGETGPQELQAEVIRRRDTRAAPPLGGLPGEPRAHGRGGRGPPPLCRELSGPQAATIGPPARSS